MFLLIAGVNLWYYIYNHGGVIMKYQELYNEYSELLYSQTKLKQRLKATPRGYITTKKISGKEYHYLQYTYWGKKKSEYLREAEVESVREKLLLRDALCKEIENTQANLDRIEKAVMILDQQLSRTFFYLRQCAEMDALPVSKRERALSFARAMTSLEGLPAKETTEENLQLWAKGEKSFAEFYLPALQDYRVMEVPR